MSEENINESNPNLEKDYSANSITVLEGLEAVRKRPENFWSSTYLVYPVNLV